VTVTFQREGGEKVRLFFAYFRRGVTKVIVAPHILAAISIANDTYFNELGVAKRIISTGIVLN